MRAARDLPLARSVIWVGTAWGLIGGGYEVLLAGHVMRDLRGGALLLGAVYAADGLSVLAGSLLGARLPPARHLSGYAVAYLVQGLAWALAFALGSLPAFLTALVIMRLASGVIIALDTTILLRTVPGRVRGRVVSLHLTTYGAVARLSLAALGAVLGILSVRTVGIAAGLLSAAIGVAWWRRSGRLAAPLYLAR
jgi:hypothetical protein